jgi:hypothetical protein
VTERLQVVEPGPVVGEDQENRVEETLDGLMKLEGGELVLLLAQNIFKYVVEFLCTGEPLLEVRSGVASAFPGIELGNRGTAYSIRDRNWYAVPGNHKGDPHAFPGL